MAIKVILSFVPLLGTSIGAILGISEIIYKKLKLQEDILISVATGILMAINISLLLEAIPFMKDVRNGKSLVIGIFLGIIFIKLMNLFAHTAETATRHKLFWAMLIHNIPEGVLVGIALTESRIMHSIPIIFSITLQNAPDGMVVSVPFTSSLGKKKAFLLGVLSGSVEPVAAILIMQLSQYMPNLQYIEPYLIGFSLSAITFINRDLLKECQSKKITIIAAFVSILFLNCF